MTQSSSEFKDEVWKWIKGYEGFYEVSNKGRIRSYKNNKWGRLKTPRILIPHIDTGGYSFTTVSSGKKYRISRLVAKAFIPNSKNKKVVNHKNFIRIDNRVENLEWCTASENAKYSVRAGRMKTLLCGEKNPFSKLKEWQVKKILNMDVEYPKFTQREVAKIFGISQHTIWGILNKRTWKHLI